MSEHWNNNGECCPIKGNGLCVSANFRLPYCRKRVTKGEKKPLFRARRNRLSLPAVANVIGYRRVCGGPMELADRNVVFDSFLPSDIFVRKFSEKKRPRDHRRIVLSSPKNTKTLSLIVSGYHSWNVIRNDKRSALTLVYSVIAGSGVLGGRSVQFKHEIR